MEKLSHKDFLVRLVVITAYLLALYALYSVRDILASLLLAWVFVLISHPILSYLESKKMPTVLAALLCILGFFLFFSFFFALLMPLLSAGFISLSHALSEHQETLKHFFSLETISRMLDGGVLNRIGLQIQTEDIVSDIQSYDKQIMSHLVTFLQAIGRGVQTGIFWFFWTVTTLLFTVVLTFFLMLERRSVGNFLISELPKKTGKTLLSIWPNIQTISKKWLRAQLFLSLCMGVMAYVWLFIVELLFSISIPGHLSLSLLVMIADFIPFLGPFLALIPALFIVAPFGLNVMIAVFVTYMAIQQIEGVVLIPRILGKALDVSDFLVMVALAVFGSLFGIFWILFTVPLIAILREFYYAFVSGNSSNKP